MRRTYAEMLRINEEKICRIEEEFIENAGTKHGHVFDAWKEMKQGRFGQGSAAPGMNAASTINHP